MSQLMAVATITKQASRIVSHIYKNYNQHNCQASSIPLKPVSNLIRIPNRNLHSIEESHHYHSTARSWRTPDRSFSISSTQSRAIAAAATAPAPSSERMTPFNLPKWLESNSHLLQPPVNNFCLYNEDFTVMVVGGPNGRTDYHLNETAEWFYQYKGAMLLKTVDVHASKSSGVTKFRDIPIYEGDMFLLPPNTPHNPVRFANTIGVVIEQKRPENSIDRLRWYCQACHAQVHEAAFFCTDLGTQIKTAVEAFREDPDARKCGACGETCDILQPKSVTEPVRS